MIPTLVHVAQIENRDADRALVAWDHKMGPCNCPMGIIRAHGLFAHGKLCAVAVTADLVAATCAGLSRDEAIEIARLCAIRPDLCRVMLRLWREFVFPAFGKPWAVSYQDENLHTGNTYRFDGWVKMQEHARSGTDKRSGRVGRVKTVWGWNVDKSARLTRAVSG